MNKYLVNSACDELDEFRIRKTDDAFIKNLRFKSKTSLSRAEVKDLTLIYDGPKNAELIQMLLPSLGSQVKLEPTTSIQRSNKSASSMPENADIVEIVSDRQNMTCLRFNEVLQIHSQNKNIYSLCPFGCTPEDKVNPSLMALNPMNLHR